jgi:hypothetical protein
MILEIQRVPSTFLSKTLPASDDLFELGQLMRLYHCHIDSSSTEIDMFKREAHL